MTRLSHQRIAEQASRVRLAQTGGYSTLVRRSHLLYLLLAWALLSKQGISQLLDFRAEQRASALSA